MFAVRRDGGVTGLGVLPRLWRVILDQGLNGNYGSVEVPKSAVPECSEPDGREHPQMAGCRYRREAASLPARRDETACVRATISART